MLESNGTNPVFVSEGGLGLGNGFGILAIIIIALMAFRSGFFGGNNGNGDNTAALLAALGMNANRNSTQYATSNEVQRGFDNQNTMANQREILAAVTSGTAQSVAATNQSFHDTLAIITDKYGELTRDIGNVQLAQAQALANQNQCLTKFPKAVRKFATKRFAVDTLAA